MVMQNERGTIMSTRIQLRTVWNTLKEIQVTKKRHWDARDEQTGIFVIIYLLGKFNQNRFV